MAFYVLSEQGYCDLLVTTIVLENAPKYFKDLNTSGRLPDIRVVKGLWLPGSRVVMLTLSSLEPCRPHLINITLDKITAA